MSSGKTEFKTFLQLNKKNMSGQLGRIYKMTLAQSNSLIVTPESPQYGDSVFLTDGYSGNGPGYYLKNSDSTYTFIGGGSVSLPNNPFDFYLDNTVSNDGDGSVEKPFKFITSLNSHVLSLSNPSQTYSAHVAPSDTSYGGEVVGFLPIAQNLSLIGEVPQDTGISCDIHLVAGAFGITNQYRDIALNGIFTADLTLATFASLVFQNGVVNINRIDSNSSGFVLIQGGISGANIIGGNVIISTGVMFGDVNIGPGATVFTSNLLVLSGSLKLTGNCNLKTLGTFNPSNGYVNGTVDGSGTPTWFTDGASSADFTGTVNKVVLGGGASGSFTSADAKTITVVDGIITSII